MVLEGLSHTTFSPILVEGIKIPLLICLAPLRPAEHEFSECHQSHADTMFLRSCTDLTRCPQEPVKN